MFLNYLKIALKVMTRHKLFTFISLFGISFTLLILVLITSIIDHTFGPYYPEKKLDQTLSITMGLITSDSGASGSGPLFSPWFFNKYVKTLKTPKVISISSYHNPIQVYKGERKINMGLKYTDSEFWEIMDFEFLEGKPFNKQQEENIEHVAVINERLRNEYFDGFSCVGEYIEADGENYRVIGVVKNVSILRIMPYADIWVPTGHTNEDLNKATLTSNFPGWFAMLLAYEKKDFPKIQAELQKHLDNIEFPEGRYNSLLTNASTYGEAIARQMFRKEDGNIGPFMLILFTLMTIFMVLPAVNLVNINMSRIIERSSEIGIRKSFGASSITLVGQFIVENIIVTLIGGLLSLVLAAVILGIVNQSQLLPDMTFTLNFRIFLTSMLIAIFFGFISGVYPAYKMSRLQPAEIIQGGSK
ncbi:MAG: ABC transporter permease [Candidatus Tenebribacter burtonii]|nr:ABC transporter permease [Candidatus Tenebribacter burtonii]